MEVAHKLRRFLQENRITAAALSQKSGIPEARLTAILSGKRRLEFGDYQAVCRALGVPVSTFLEPCPPSETASTPSRRAVPRR